MKYGRGVGGGTVHFTANYWRFHPIDFAERSKRGTIPGSSFDDWPITYEELEPYYTKVDWEVGVSGLAGANPFDPPRSRPYPMAPLPIKSTGVLFERGARKLGWHPAPAPMAIASEAYRGRAACINCGFCEFFGCEMGAKSSTLVTMIPEAVATGRCEIRPNSYVRKVETNAAGRVTGVKYFDGRRKEMFQRAKAVVLCANGAESPRLLLMSSSSRFPQGLANGSGMVGTNIMFNGSAIGGGLFEHEVNGYKGAVVSRILHDFYELPDDADAIGGGGIDFRHDLPPVAFAIQGLGPTAPKWGSDYKKLLRQWYTRSVYAFGHTTQLPVPTNAISLDPTVRDAWGLPALRVTFTPHPNDRKVAAFFARPRRRAARCRRCHVALDVSNGRRHVSRVPSARDLPDGHRSALERRGQVPSRSRRAESVHRGRIELRHERSRPAHDDDSGARVPRGRAHRRGGQARRDLSTCGHAAAPTISYPTNSPNPAPAGHRRRRFARPPAAVLPSARGSRAAGPRVSCRI